MAIRKDAGGLGWTIGRPKDDEKKKKKPKLKTGNPKKPGLSGDEIRKQVQKQAKHVQQQQAQAPPTKPAAAPPKKPGKVSSLEPFYKIIEANGQLEIDDIRYLQKLAWTTKDKNTPEDLRAGIDAARKFFEENPDLKKVAGLKYNAFHEQGKVVDSKWYRAMMATLDANKAAAEGQQYLKDNAALVRHIPEGADLDRASDEGVAPAIAPEFSAADLTAETADAIVHALVDVGRSGGLTEAESEKLFSPENVVKIENVTDFDGQGPGFIVHYSDGINKSKQAILWTQVPKRLKPGGQIEAGASVATGGTLPTDQHLDMLNEVWRDVFKGTQAARGIPEDVLPALLSSGFELRNKAAARKAFEALRDPYLTDPRNPYAENPEVYFRFLTKQQDILTDNTNETIGDPYDAATIAAQNDPTALQGVFTPFEDEGFTDISGKVYWGETHPDMLRLDGLIVAAAKEYEGLPKLMQKAGQVLSRVNLQLPAGDHAMTMMDIIEEWTGVKSPDGSFTLEQEEAIREKQYYSALMRSLADPKDDEADYYLANEHGLPMVEGSVAKAFFDKYVPERIVYTPEEIAGMTAEERELAKAEVVKTREERYAELATRLAVESKLPFESDASAVYKLYKINPDLVMPEYKQLFDIAHESVEKEYGVILNKRGDVRPQVKLDPHAPPTKAPKIVVRLTPGQKESIVYTAINMAEANLYPEAEPELPPEKRRPAGKVGYVGGERPVEAEGSLLTSLEQAWNAIFHHPVATVLEQSQLSEGQRLVETGRSLGAVGRGRSMNTEWTKQRRDELVAQYAEYMTAQRLAHPEMDDEDFKGTWSMLSWTWNDLKRRGGGYINMGTYFLQESDPNYQKGDNLLAEFLIDSVYEFALFAPLGAGTKQVKNAAKLSDAWRAKRAAWHTHLGQSTVGDFAVKCTNAFTFMDRWGLDAQTSVRLADARDIQTVNKIYDGLGPLQKLKFDIGQWDMPLRAKLAFKAKLVQHPALDRFLSISGTHTVGGGNFPLDHRAARNAFERAYAGGLSYEDAQAVAEIFTRVWAREISGEGALRSVKGFAEVYPETVLRSMQRTLMSRQGALDAAAGKVPKGLRKRVAKLTQLNDELARMSHAAQRLVDEIEVARKAAGAAPKEAAARHIDELERRLDQMNRRIRKLSLMRDKVRGAGSFRPAPAKRTMSDVERRLGQYVSTPSEVLDIQHNMKVLFDDLEDLIRARNQRIPATDKWRIKRFHKEYPGTSGEYWDEMVRTASYQALDSEGNFVPEMLTKEFVEEHGFISEDRLAQWWRDKVRPVTRREAEAVKGREAGQIYAPKQGGEAPVETSKTVGPHEAMELVRARQRAAREQRKLRRELRRIAPRVNKDMEEYTQRLIRNAGLREEEAYVEAQRMILRDLAQRADIDPSALRHFDDSTMQTFLNLAHEAEVGDDIAELWKTHWHKLVDELDEQPGAFVKEGPAVTYKTPKAAFADLAEAQRVVRSKRRRADLAEQMYYYGRQPSSTLRAERDLLRGVGWQTVAEDLGFKVTISPRPKWPASVRKDLVGMTVIRGGEVKHIFIDRSAIHLAFEQNMWPTGMVARGSRKLPREVARTKEGLEDYIVAHELAHATGIKAEEIADRIASRISRRREIVDTPPPPWKTPKTIDDYMDPLLVRTTVSGKKVWAHPPEATLDIDMPPEQYLAESRNSVRLGVDEGDSIGDVTKKYANVGQDAAVRRRLESGQTVDPVVLDGYLDGGVVSVRAGSVQNGDHRALAAMEIGYDTIPVKVRVFVQEGPARRPATAEELAGARFHTLADPDDFPDLRVRPRGIDSELRTRRLTVVDKILAQRVAESDAITRLRTEIDELQKIIDQAQHATPEQIAAGRVPAAALGNYAESPQPLVPSQLQAIYQPPVDPRLEMIWRSGKGARLLEEFNTHPKSFFGITSMDRATNIFKVAILARVSTALRIVLADEFTRLLPEGINPIQARVYLKELLEYEAETGRRVLPGELRAELNQIYGVIRKSSYMPLDPGDPDFIAAYTGMLQQWASDPVVQLWKNAYKAAGGGDAGVEAAKEALRVAAHTPDSVVAAHLRLSNRWWPANLSMDDVYGAVGAKDQMSHLRKAFESKNVDDWVEVASEQFSFFARNKWTSRHFLDGLKPKARHFKGAKGTFGKGVDAPPIVVGRMDFGDVQKHWWLPQVAFGKVLESASGQLTEIVYTHMYVQYRTAALADLARDMRHVIPAGVDVTDIWQAHKWLDADTLTQVEALSAQYAEQITTKIMYTAGTSGAEDVLRNIILFLPAQRQYIAYWAKAIMQNPVLLAYFHRLNAMPDYLEFHAPWNREGEMSKLYLRGLLFATPGFQEDSLQSKAYQMLPGLGMPGVILGSAVGVADMAGFSKPRELAMKLPQGDYYEDTWRPLNSSLTQLSYGLSTILVGRPYNLLPEQVAGDNTSNLWKFAEAIKAQVARVLKGDGKGRVDMTKMPDLEGGANWNAARTHGLQALLSAGWNFLVPVKYSIVDEDAQKYMDLQVEWNSLETYGQRMDFIARNRTSNFVKVLQLELADSEEDRQRLLYNNPELMPYYVSNVGFISPAGEEYDFGNVVQESKKLFMSKMDIERSLQLRKELDAETAWFENVYMPALRRREPWTGGNINLTGASAAYTPDSPSNLIRVRKDWENSTGAFGAGSITDKDGKVHFGIGRLREEIGSGAYLSKSDFASDPDSAIYKATELLFESRAGARFVRTSRHYDDFVDLYRISHKEGEEEAILAAMQPFTQMSELERASVFGKKWTEDEEWILQRVASVWDQYEEGYKAWLKKTDKNGNHPNAGKDHGDFRYTDYGEALYAAVTNEVWKHLAGPKSSPVLAGGIAQQMLYTPLVRPHFVIYEDPEKNRQPSDPINAIERMLDRQTGMGNQPGVHGGPLSDIPQTLPKWDESGTRKVKYGEKALPERLVPGVMASVALAARIKTTKDGQMYLVWSKADLKQLESESEYLKTYMKTADPVTKYNVREAQRAFTWTLFLRSMAATTRQAWGVRSEYQQWNSGYRGRSSSETITKKYIKKLEKQFLPAFFEASPLFKREWEYYNKKAGGNLIADMVSTYR